MDKKNKLVFEGVGEPDFQIIASKLQNMIESNALHYIYFSGGIGAGKTSYIRILLKNIGITENIKSPSFSMIECYRKKKKTICHVDLFRMENPSAWQHGEIRSLFEEDDNLVFLEWPEKAKGLPCPDIHFTITLGNYKHEEKKRDVSMYLKRIQLLEMFNKCDY